jgi:hypothetical protein
MELTIYNIQLNKDKFQLFKSKEKLLEIDSIFLNDFFKVSYHQLYRKYTVKS